MIELVLFFIFIIFIVLGYILYTISDASGISSRFDKNNNISYRDNNGRSRPIFEIKDEGNENIILIIHPKIKIKSSTDILDNLTVSGDFKQSVGNR